MALGGLLSQIAPQILQQLGGQGAPAGLLGGEAQPAPQVLAGAFQGKAAGKKHIAAALHAAATPPGLLDQVRSTFPQVVEAIRPQIVEGQQERRERLRALMSAGSIQEFNVPQVGGFQGPQAVNFTGLLGG